MYFFVFSQENWNVRGETSKSIFSKSGIKIYFKLDRLPY